MTHSGGRRVRSVARWVATPGLVAAAGLAGYANVVGATQLLRVSTVVALAVAVGAVVMFDTQLVRARRSHNAERAALARSYAATYAAHIRVTDPGSPSEWGPVSDQPPAPWPAASSAPTVSVTTGATPSPAVARSAAAPHTVASTPVDTAATSSSSHSMADSASTAASAQNSNMWDELEDAPTVVDMLAWEERARVGIVDSGQKPASGSSGANASEGTGSSNRQPTEEPTDDPRLHLHGPENGRAESA